eukprot:g4340.t1
MFAFSARRFGCHWSAGTARRGSKLFQRKKAARLVSPTETVHQNSAVCLDYAPVGAPARATAETSTSSWSPRYTGGAGGGGTFVERCSGATTSKNVQEAVQKLRSYGAEPAGAELRTRTGIDGGAPSKSEVCEHAWNPMNMTVEELAACQPSDVVEMELLRRYRDLAATKNTTSGTTAVTPPARPAQPKTKGGRKTALYSSELHELQQAIEQREAQNDVSLGKDNNYGTRTLARAEQEGSSAVHADLREVSPATEAEYRDAVDTIVEAVKRRERSFLVQNNLWREGMVCPHWGGFVPLAAGIGLLGYGAIEALAFVKTKGNECWESLQKKESEVFCDFDGLTVVCSRAGRP